MFYNSIIAGIGYGIGFTIVILCLSCFLLFKNRQDLKRDGAATLSLMQERNELDRQKVAVLTDICMILDNQSK